MSHNDREPHAGYETSDVAAKPIIISGVILFLFLIGSAALVGWLYSIIAPPAEVIQPKDFPAYDSTKSTAAPRLQSAPAADMTKFTEAESKRLNNYGWVDEAKGIAHIPIEAAKKRMSFPAR